MKSKKMIVTLLLCLSCVSIFSKAYNVDISISPASPTSYDEVMVDISGDWGDSCIPDLVSTTRDGNSFNIIISRSYTPDACSTVITSFFLSKSLGLIEQGNYSIEIVFFDDLDTTYNHTFHVSNIKLDKYSIEVPEQGTAEFEVSLFEDPTTEVQVNIEATSDSDPDIIITSGSVLVFNAENYSNPQIVTLSALKDADNDNGEAKFEVKVDDYVTASINVTEIDNDYPPIIYVDQNASGTNDGSSWENAFTSLKEALNKAGEMSATEEIKIAGGFYKSKENPEDTTDYIRIVSGIKYSGCYAGVKYIKNPDLRSIFSFPTVLSSDINGDDGPNFSNRDDNVKKGVVLMNVCDSNTILDGLIISGGESAGGIYISSGTPTVTNCIITNNRDYLGAGIDIRGGSPIIKNCLITGNYSTLSTGADGGGIYAYGSGTDEVNLNNCTIAYNTASDIGGGVHLHSGKININDSIIWGNIATLGDPTTNQLSTIFDGTIEVSYSCIQDAEDLDGINGNIIANPEFAANHLGQYFLSNIVKNPCIDTGSDNALDLNMNNKTTDTNLNDDTDIVDMGFHYPYYINTIGDVDLNNEVNIIDALLIARVYVGIKVELFIFENADYNSDGNINIIDALRVAQYYVGL